MTKTDLLNSLREADITDIDWAYKWMESAEEVELMTPFINGYLQRVIETGETESLQDAMIGALTHLLPNELAVRINDTQGHITVAEMQVYFENEIKRSEPLRIALPLNRVLANGKFANYGEENTDLAWVGFALGMRRAEIVHREEAVRQFEAAREWQKQEPKAEQFPGGERLDSEHEIESEIEQRERSQPEELEAPGSPS